MSLLCKDTPTTEIYTLSLHDALPISVSVPTPGLIPKPKRAAATLLVTKMERNGIDRKSTRLNSSHITSSYAVFCLKKKKDNFLAAIAEVAVQSIIAVETVTCRAYAAS